MDPITIGVAIAGAKKLIEISSDIKDVAGALDNLFHLTDKAEKAKSAAEETDTSYKSVIKDVVTERNNRTLLRNLEISVDEKFGFGTWSAIREERDKRLVAVEENKLKKAKALKTKQKADKEFYDKILYWLGELAKLALVLGLSAGAGYVIYINRCVSGNC